MQHRYVGDIGDFGKFGLLNYLLSGKHPLRLGALWLLTHPDGREALKNDGRHTGYLSASHPERYLACDRTLYKKLKKIHATNRHLSEIKRCKILPPKTLYWEEEYRPPIELPFYRQLYRQTYLNLATLHLKDTDFLFCDPDNGLEIPSVGKTNRAAGKYIYDDEIEMFWRLGKSLLIYNHRARQTEAAVRSRYKRLKAKLGLSRIEVFRFRAWSQRDFLLLAQPRHRKYFWAKAKQFHSTPWVKEGLFECFAV